MSSADRLADIGVLLVGAAYSSPNSVQPYFCEPDQTPTFSGALSDDPADLNAEVWKLRALTCYKQIGMLAEGLQKLPTRIRSIAAIEVNGATIGIASIVDEIATAGAR